MKTKSPTLSNLRAVKNSLFVIIFAAMIVSGCKDKPSAEQEQLTVVKFGMLPYGDHSQAIIGAKKGWFKEVGIDLQYSLIKIEGVVPELNNKRLDVVSTPPGVLLSSYDNAKGLCTFVLADVFQGYAIMAQPGKYKSYADFIKSGLSPNDAIKAAVLQLKGKTFAYPSETAIKPFIDILLSKSGVSKSDFTSIVQDDALNITTMRTKKADFQVGGAPSRITLQKEGFQAIVSSIDIVKAAVPSPDSKELASVFQDGWAVRKDYYNGNKTLMLKLASVCFRISDYINNQQDSALAIHMPYLTKITGETFTAEDGKVIYNSLDPFYGFDAQKSWFHNDKDPLYYKNLYGSIINSFKDQGIYKNGTPTVDDLIYADDIYIEMEGLRDKTLENFKTISAKNLAADGEKKDKLTKAKHYFDIFDFVDSEKLSAELAK